jgi:hypothetical protein
MSTREEQRETSVGGQKNLGSNRNAEGTRQVTNRERVQHQVVEAHGAVPEFTIKLGGSTSKARSSPRARAASVQRSRAAQHSAGTSARSLERKSRPIVRRK